MNIALTHKASPAVPAEVIQKLNVMAAARAVAGAARRGLRRVTPGNRVKISPARAQRIEQGLRRSERNARAGATSVTRNGNTTTYRRELGRVQIGVRSDGPAVSAIRNRVAQARAAGSRVGAHLRIQAYSARQGYGMGRAAAIHQPGMRRAFQASFAAGNVARRGVDAAQGAVRVGRVWVHNAAVAGGGFWRRVTGR